MSDLGSAAPPLLGFNYHPSSGGCRYWTRFRADEIRADFEAMGAEGWNVVRFFVFWADFEPEVGRYNEEAFAHLGQMASMAASAGLRCIPSILTLWMNGQLLDLPWRGGRDLIADPEVRTRARELARRVAATLGPVGNVAYYDLGDELPNVLPARRAEPDAVRAWYAEMADAIRSADPGALVIQANEAAVLDAAPAFGPPTQQGVLDAVALHGFPLWSRLGITGADVYAASVYPAFLAAVASAFGPALVDEFGTYGMMADAAARHVGAAAASVLARGVQGLVSWCWKDITSDEWPYIRRPGERDAGFRTADGVAKPAYAALRHAIQSAAAPSFHAASPQVGIALGADGRLASAPASLFGCYLALLASHHRPAFFTGLAHLDPERFPFVAWPGVRSLHLDELEALEAYAAAGGVALVSSRAPAPGTGGEGLFGLDVDGFGTDPDARPIIELPGGTVHLGPVPEDALPYPIVRVDTAEVLGRFEAGDPAVTVKRHGDGCLYFVNAPCEATAPVGAIGAPAPAELYRQLLAYAGFDSGIRAPAGVEVIVGCDGSAVAINHFPKPVAGELSFLSTSLHVSLEAKEVARVGGAVP
ncbi:MAG: hypothetical protein WD184_03100 [Acidimicrobiia bacterium]